MNELPEVINLGNQLGDTVAGKTVTSVFNATKPHKFTFYTGDPKQYGTMLTGHQVESAEGRGMFTQITFSGDQRLTIGDGVNVRFGDTSAKVPKDYQLLITFDDETFLVFTVAMYGFIAVFEGENSEKYYRLSFDTVSPLEDGFDYGKFEALFGTVKPTHSVKQLLATEQRIPGLGNGVLQDILYNAGIHPKKKALSLTHEQRKELFLAVKNTLREMKEAGGRDTEKDLFGNPGGYVTKLSKLTHNKPCERCGSAIVKEAYMGGSVYYCPSCQKL